VLLAGYFSLIIATVAGPVAPESGTGAKPVQVVFDAPEGCSGAGAFFKTLRSRTDRVRQAEGKEPRTTLQVRLTRSRGQVVGELRMADDRGGGDTRKVQGANCDEVVQALSLTAALALDPSALNSAPVTTAVPVSSTSSAPAPVPPVAPAVTKKPPAEPSPSPDSISARASRPVPSVELGAGPVGATVLSGSYSFGVEVFARKIFAGKGSFRPTLGLAVAYLRNDVLQTPQDVQVGLAGLAGTVCPLRWTSGVLTFQPCGLFLAGWLSASGRQVTQSRTVDRLWLSAGGVARAAVLFGRGISVELEGGLSAPLLKRRFYATVPSNVVAETPKITPIVGLRLTFGL